LHKIEAAAVEDCVVEHLAETVDWAAQEAVAEVETREPPWSGVTQLFLTYGSLGGLRTRRGQPRVCKPVLCQREFDSADRFPATCFVLPRLVQARSQRGKGETNR
jgi:hypothetical protein